MKTTKLKIEKKIEEIESTMPVPKPPRKDALKFLEEIPLLDLDTLPDKGPNSLSRLLNISTAASAYASYELGKARAIYAVTKDPEHKAVMHVWEGLNEAYQRIVATVSREISLRRDSFEREKVPERTSIQRYK